MLLLILAALLIGLLFEQSSSGRRDFLVSRYSIDYGLSGRDWIWEMAMSRIAEDPFLGRGMGATDVVSNYSFHNTYLEVWFYTGLLGLVLFVGSQLYFLFRIIHLSRMTKDAEIRSVLALALGYMLGFVALCMVESAGAGASNINVILYIFLGVLVSSDWLLDSAASQRLVNDRQEESHSLPQMTNLPRKQELGGVIRSPGQVNTIR
jgi:O-antigen ligase